MPVKKNSEESGENLVSEQIDQQPRSLDSYSRYKKLNRPMYHRMKYEIREDPKQKKSIEDWDKLYNKLKF